MSNAILTIAIPTYNRPDKIQKQVRLLLPQLTPEVKLTIRDNNSLRPVVSLFNTTEKQLFTIIRNNVNIGGDANIARCMDSCDTEWLWILGDDDFVSENAVEIVLTQIKENPNAIWLNFECSINCNINNSQSFYESVSSHIEFGNSFWISKCIYRMKALKVYMPAYYESMSSMIGQFAILLTYCIKTNSFSGKKFKVSLFQEHLPAEWSYEKFVERTSFLIKIYDLKNNRLLRGVLKGLTNQRLRMINENSRNKTRLFSMIINDYGIINTILDFPDLIIRKIPVIYLPTNLVKFFRKF